MYLNQYAFTRPYAFREIMYVNTINTSHTVAVGEKEKEILFYITNNKIKYVFSPNHL